MGPKSLPSSVPSHGLTDTAGAMGVPGSTASNLLDSFIALAPLSNTWCYSKRALELPLASTFYSEDHLHDLFVPGSPFQ